jgi:LmbE family N-acetylglucosaminyl deacetylase
MKFRLPTAEVFIPDGLPEEQALARTTHLAVAAHPDDLEIMAAGPILECFQQTEKWFCGVVATDGGGSPRDGLYREYSDEAMQRVRSKEQKKATVLGEYGALVLLNYPSQAVKDPAEESVVMDLQAIFRVAKPQVICTHNLADKHDTHVAVALRTIAALRLLPPGMRPEHLYGCEVWRDLDWLADEDKVAFDLSARENLQAALLGAFDSQVSGGKRYDLASLGRRRANATYFASHDTDTATGLSYAMDLTPVVADPSLDITDFVQEFIDRFAYDVRERIARHL